MHKDRLGEQTNHLKICIRIQHLFITFIFLFHIVVLRTYVNEVLEIDVFKSLNEGAKKRGLNVLCKKAV